MCCTFPPVLLSLWHTFLLFLQNRFCRFSCPILLAGSHPSNISSYLLISHFSFFLKSLNVYYQLSLFLIQNDHQDLLQSGLKATHSTCAAIVAVTEKLHTERSAKLSLVLNFLDFSEPPWHCQSQDSPVYFHKSWNWWHSMVVVCLVSACLPNCCLPSTGLLKPILAYKAKNRPAPT